MAANKIDRISGWLPVEGAPLAATLKAQSERVRGDLDNRIYELVGELYKQGFNSDRYDRISDFTKNIGVVPISSISGEGVADLLMVLLGLAQKFLKENLKLRAAGPVFGTIRVVHEETGPPRPHSPPSST